MKRTASVCITLLAALVASASLVAAGGAAKQGDERPFESLPEGRSAVSIEVHPKSIELTNRFAYAQLLVTATLDSGERADVTRMARVAGADGVVEVSPFGRVRPRADGAGELVIEMGAARATVPVKVSGADGEYRVSYVRDVMPTMSRIGCNQGTCHGSAGGKNGFKLSLRGYDPLFDYRALTDDLKGRRFNRASADKSLFLMKIGGRAPHQGGVLARPGEPYYELLKDWVEQGVTVDLDNGPRVVSVEVVPDSVVMPLPGMRQQIVVYAKYSDGSVRDVTGEAFLESSDTEITTVDRRGIVTAVRRGEAATLTRFEGRYAATQFFVMGDRSGFEWVDAPTSNWIDELVYAKLRRIKSLPSELCTDAEFLRRIYLDMTGLPPRAKDVRIFLADARPSNVKREEVIDRLIGSAEFVEHWTNKWSDLLQVNSKFLGDEGAKAYRDWIRQAVASNTAYDEFVRAVLDSSGSTLKEPATAYYKVLREPDLVMEDTTQLFLGIRFSCNKCHDHPFERWTQSDHWELAAFFAQVGRKDAPGSPKMPRRDATQTDIPAFEEIIFDKEDGEISYPDSNRQASPEFPYEFGETMPLKGSRRGRLALWVTSPKNPYFAKSFVNRLWSYLLGVGFIEPVDDIRAGNPPTNPELLDRLTNEFIESGFDVRHLIRLICRSRTYQHSIKTNRWNDGDDINFGHALARRLPAETLFDAVHQVTGSVATLPGQRRGTRAAELTDPSTKVSDGFLDLFGRPPRESACECERSSSMSLAQALSLVNGPTISDSVNDPENAIADLVRVEKRPARIVEELYLSILSRPPTDEERTELAKVLNHRDIASTASLTPENAAELEKRLAAWEAAQTVIEWKPLEAGIARSAGGATLTAEADASVIASGTYPDKDTYTVVSWTDLAGITGFRLEVLTDERLKTKDTPGPGRPENGNLVLSELIVAAAPVSDPSKAAPVALQNASASFAQNEFAVGLAIDGKRDDNKGWAIAPQTGRRHVAVFETKEDVGAAGGTILTFTLDQQFDKHSIGKFRLSATTTKRPVRVMTLPENIIAILKTPAGERTPQQRAALFSQYMTTDRDMADRIRLNAAQDLAWVLLNNPAFLFNR